MAKRKKPPTGLDTLLERLWDKIDVRDTIEECWPWLGGKTKDGYGTIHIEMRNGRPFRRSVTSVLYETAVGPLPLDKKGKPYEPDHQCRNQRCANPFHLEEVTHEENVRRASPTVCPHGHDYTPENTYTDSRGARHCRKCGTNRGRLRALRTRTKLQPFEGGEIQEITWDRNQTVCVVKIMMPREGLKYVKLTREEVSLLMGWE